MVRRGKQKTDLSFGASVLIKTNGSMLFTKRSAAQSLLPSLPLSLSLFLYYSRLWILCALKGNRVCIAMHLGLFFVVESLACLHHWHSAKDNPSAVALHYCFPSPSWVLSPLLPTFLWDCDILQVCWCFWEVLVNFKPRSALWCACV